MNAAPLLQTRPARIAARLAPSLVFLVLVAAGARADHLRELQAAAMQSGRAAWGHWGVDPEKYSGWTNHSNRLVPVYTFGIRLDPFDAENSAYRSRQRIEELYGRLPEGTYNPDAAYFDQTDVYRLQQAAHAAGKKYLVLMIFDGLDWQTTRAAAIYSSGRVGYDRGRGSGLFWLDYRGTETDFGYFVTAPYSDGAKYDIDGQVLTSPGPRRGGYDWRLASESPWGTGKAPTYVMGTLRERPHPYTDSASSASAMTSGIKTYNRSINVDVRGRPVPTIARQLQQEGLAVGVVTSVPISHATPAAAYAANVARYDYQDLSRDLLGLPSVAHREALPGVDVLLGGGWGEHADADPRQGRNFARGNKYVADADLRRVDAARGGKYRFVMRSPGVDGGGALAAAAEQAAEQGQRLLGLFGVRGGHLPYQTADGGYDPAAGVRPAEQYTAADIAENPTLAEMTQAALTVLEQNPRGFWLMIEAGDVDWANHDDNIDNSVGAVRSGDDAFRAVARWAKARGCWDETAVIVTADHGHYLVLTRPEALIAPQPER